VEQGQPEIFIGCVFPAEIEFEDVAQAVACERARLYFAAFDALDGARADFAVFRQFFLGKAILLAEFCDLQSKVGLVHGVLLIL
jgi:hypothetical protein